MPHSDPFSVEFAIKRAETLEKIRSFFKDRNLLEIETPILSRGVSTDCYLDTFSTHFSADGYSLSEKSTTLYLQTSPELLMKRLFSEGFPDIYQICKVFRNGERGRIHNHEFTMLEWYRRSFRMHDLINEVAELCQAVLGKKSVISVSYKDIFFQSTGLDPLLSTEKELLDFCVMNRKEPPVYHDLSDLHNYMMCEFVEPVIDKNALFFIHNFPAQLAIMARLDPEEPQTALRFELYCGGVELCNGYEELSLKKDITLRMIRDNEKREKIGKPRMPLDERFLNSIPSLPQCSGVALGVDRLLMLLVGSETVDSVIPFPFEEC